MRPKGLGPESAEYTAASPLSPMSALMSFKQLSAVISGSKGAEAAALSGREHVGGWTTCEGCPVLLRPASDACTQPFLLKAFGELAAVSRSFSSGLQEEHAMKVIAECPTGASHQPATGRSLRDQVALLPTLQQQ